MNNEIEEFKEMLYGYSTDKFLLIEKHLYLNIFLYDKNWSIRREVAIEGFYHNILMYDDSIIRYYVAINTKDKSILEHLSNDKDYNVKHQAIKTLKELYNE